jgi:hypothetical protein
MALCSLPWRSSQQNIEIEARLVRFGEIEGEGTRYTHDVVIDDGKVRKRKKGPSKQFREKFGHTSLSPEEEIPWGGKQLMVGTGPHGALPIMNEVRAASLQLCDVIIASFPRVLPQGSQPRVSETLVKI